MNDITSGQESFSYKECNQPSQLSFYKWDPTFGLKRIFGNLKSTYGIAFDYTRGKLYHLDKCQSLITSFDVLEPTGDLCNGRVAFDFKTISKSIQVQYIIGLDVDSNGILYTVSNTGIIYVIDPLISTVINEIKLPVHGCNGITFGGPHRNILYVVASRVLTDKITSQVVGEVTNGSSLYMVTGLGVKANKLSSLVI